MRAALLLLLVTCTPAPRGDDADAGSPSTVAATSAPAAASTSAPAASPAMPMPVIDVIARIHLRMGQGARSEPHCKRIAYEIDFDVATGAWTHARCDPQPGDPSGEEPLREQHGTLPPQRRASLEVAYTKLRRGAGACPSDAGRVGLEVTRVDGTKESFASCGEPPADVALGLALFASALSDAVQAP